MPAKDFIGKVRRISLRTGSTVMLLNDQLFSVLFIATVF